MTLQKGREFTSQREASLTEASPVVRQRIIQIHPTLKCNLRCQHCYSNSAPSLTGALDVDLLCGALSDAAEMGYEVAAFSGGEPLLYRGLEAALTHAKACGMRTTVTTNGTVLHPQRLRRLAASIDLMAISLDGPPALHNEIRKSPRAFNQLLAGLEHLRAAGLRFGFIHTLTRKSWSQLLWVAQFAAQEGAALLQLHPLEMTGRAASLMTGEAPDDDILARVYLLTLVLAEKYRGSMTIQFDAFRADDLRENPELVYASDLDATATPSRPADLLGLIVVEADGAVVPISYGVHRAYMICDLRHQRLGDAWYSYLGRGYAAFRRLCREVFQEASRPSELPFLNWHELIVARSHDSGNDLSAVATTR